MAQTSPARQRSAPPPRPRRRPPPPKRGKGGRIFGFVLIGLLAGLSGYAGFLYRNSAALQKYLPAFLHPQATPAQAFPGRQSLNILVIGRDADYSDADQRLHTRGRSDMLMMAHLNFAAHDVSLLSVPRDTLVPIDGHGVTKINAAHMFGGPTLTAQTVQSNFGLSTDKYVDLDFAGFQKAIDELGGVDLAVDKQMDYDDNWGHLHIHLKPGFQHLTGEQAMGFVRFRHSDSDLVRVQRQQALLAALKAKLHDPRILSHLPAILDTLDTHLGSDLSPEQKVVLARFLQSTPREQVIMTTLPSHAKGNAVVTNWKEAAPLLEKQFGATPPTLTADAAPRRAHRRRRHFSRPADAL